MMEFEKRVFNDISILASKKNGISFLINDTAVFKLLIFGCL
ncbi:hypothetical protein SAMN05660816_04834 [Niastella yeongjuensis]|nr:hypothetical protein SAMN05660816_04834 [Niastella yeongjuensis]